MLLGGAAGGAAGRCLAGVAGAGHRCFRGATRAPGSSHQGARHRSDGASVLSTLCLGLHNICALQQGKRRCAQRVPPSFDFSFAQHYRSNTGGRGCVLWKVFSQHTPATHTCWDRETAPGTSLTRPSTVPSPVKCASGMRMACEPLRNLNEGFCPLHHQFYMTLSGRKNQRSCRYQGLALGVGSFNV